MDDGGKKKGFSIFKVIVVIIFSILIGAVGGVAVWVVPQILERNSDEPKETKVAQIEERNMNNTESLVEASNEESQASTESSATGMETLNNQSTAFVQEQNSSQGASEGLDERETQSQTSTEQETKLKDKYQLVEGKYTWKEAVKECEKRGGHLVRINDYEEWVYLTEKFIPSKKKDISKILIGGRREPGSYDYYWMKGNEKLGKVLNSSDSWIDKHDLWFYSSVQRQPSFYDSETKEDELYLQMFYIKDTKSNREKGRKIGWSVNDISNSEKMSFICEFD